MMENYLQQTTCFISCIIQQNFMLSSKVKEDRIRLKTLQESLHFHLDSQEQEMALLAKKQLEACSQEFQDNTFEQRYHTKRKSSKGMRGHPMSMRTNETDNETRSFYSKNQVKSRVKNEKNQKNTRVALSQQRKIKQSSHRSLPAQKIECTRVNNLLLEKEARILPLKQESTLSRYKTKIEFYSQQKKIKTNRLNGFQSKPVSAVSRRKYFEGTTKSSRISSRKYSNMSDQQYNENIPPNKLYSFNDTFAGDFTRLQSKTLRNTEQNHEKKSYQETERPSSSRQLKIRLRPQFLRLIQKIKEKEDEHIKKNVVQIKGRRNVN